MYGLGRRGQSTDAVARGTGFFPAWKSLAVPPGRTFRPLAVLAPCRRTHSTAGPTSPATSDRDLLARPIVRLTGVGPLYPDDDAPAARVRPAVVRARRRRRPALRTRRTGVTAAGRPLRGHVADPDRDRQTGRGRVPEPDAVRPTVGGRRRDGTGHDAREVVDFLVVGPGRPETETGPSAVRRV